MSYPHLPPELQRLGELYEKIQQGTFTIKEWEDRGVMVDLHLGTLLALANEAEGVKAENAKLREQAAEMQTRLSTSKEAAYHNTDNMWKEIRTLREQRDTLQKALESIQERTGEQKTSDYCAMILEQVKEKK